MGGLRKICKMYGGMVVTGQDGKTVKWVWDYINDEPRIESEMTKDEIMASEKAKWMSVKDQIKNPTTDFCVQHNTKNNPKAGEEDRRKPKILQVGNWGEHSEEWILQMRQLPGRDQKRASNKRASRFAYYFRAGEPGFVPPPIESFCILR